MSAPHCPKCGNAQDKLWAYCSECHFNAHFVDGEGWRASMPWQPAVRRELAEQALAMRAHSMAFDSGAISAHPQSLMRHRAHVMYDYAQLGQSPLRLPGEEA